MKLLAVTVAAVLLVLILTAINKTSYKISIEPVQKESKAGKAKRHKSRSIADVLKILPAERNPAMRSDGQLGFDSRDIFEPADNGMLFEGNGTISGADDIDVDSVSRTDSDSQISAHNDKYESLGEFLATAYSGPEFNSDGITKAGTKVRLGVVAVDPKVIELGSVLLIEGYGEAVAEDTGNMIKGKHIDVWLPTVEEARRYGKKQVKVWLNKKREAKPPFNN